MKTYNLTVNKTDPTVKIKLPISILKDLVLRSEESGQTIELEISMRLARSLERDLEMIEADNDLAFKAFEQHCRHDNQNNQE